MGGTSNTVDDRFTRYEYGTGATILPSFGGTGTQQTKKTVRQGLDDNGTKVEETFFTYNLQGRMSQTLIDQDGNGTVDQQLDYTYDADGIRTSQTETTDTNQNGSLADETPAKTLYLYDANNPTGYAQILEEKDAAGSVTKTYTLGLDVIAQQASSGQLYLLYDGHGSTRGLVDATGQPLSSQIFRYDAFGNRLDNNIAMTSLLYSGEQTDRTGLQYLRARYYDPATGRFNRLDPFAGNLDDPQSLHKYLFTPSDPINFNDPNGEIFIPVIFGLVALGGAAGIGYGAYTGTGPGFFEGLVPGWGSGRALGANLAQGDYWEAGLDGLFLTADLFSFGGARVLFGIGSKAPMALKSGLAVDSLYQALNRVATSPKYIQRWISSGFKASEIAQLPARLAAFKKAKQIGVTKSRVNWTDAQNLIIREASAKEESVLAHELTHVLDEIAKPGVSEAANKGALAWKEITSIERKAFFAQHGFSSVALARGASSGLYYSTGIMVEPYFIRSLDYYIWHSLWAD